MNTYQISYRYAPEHTGHMVKASAPKPPGGIRILSAWAYVGQRAGFYLVEAANHDDIAQFIKDWRDKLDIEVRPIYPAKQ